VAELHDFSGQKFAVQKEKGEYLAHGLVFFFMAIREWGIVRPMYKL